MDGLVIPARVRTGVFGGTFDPPHIGHLVLADIALNKLELNRILWVLTEHPPHKNNRSITSIDHRLVMLRAALQDNGYFEISRVDIDRPGPHYAVDTVNLLQKTYPKDAIVYLMGSDSLVDLPNWFYPQKFVDLIDELGVMFRPGFEPEQTVKSLRQVGFFPVLEPKLHFFDAPRLDISSSQIRKLVSEKGPFRYLVPEAIYDIILEYQLYHDL